MVPTTEFDQRGDPFGRVVDGRIDIGAVEEQSSDTTPPVVTAVVRNGGGQNFNELVTLEWCSLSAKSGPKELKS